MSYPTRPHIAFPFQRHGRRDVLDGGDPDDTTGDPFDGGVVGGSGPALVDCGFAYPPDPSLGKVAVVGQDTPEHITSCAMVITVCPIGARDDRPEFGWAWPELQTPPLDTDSLRVALEQFEPRATPDITQYTDLIDQATQHINVELEIASDGDDSD